MACVAAGCFGEDDETAPGRAQPSLAADIAVEGGPRRERNLLRMVARGMDRTTLQRISIGAAAGRRKSDAGGTAVPISFTAAPGGASVRRQWDEWIVAGAFSRRLLAAGLPAEVDGTSRTGGFTARPRLKGQPDPKPLGRRQVSAIVKAIRAAVKQSGGELARLEVHRPYGVAIALVVGSRDPASFLKTNLRQLMASLDRRRSRLEGLYLAVLDETRRLALEWGSWTRNPAGNYWVRHDLTECSPIEQSLPPGSEKPPACPA